MALMESNKQLQKTSIIAWGCLITVLLFSISVGGQELIPYQSAWKYYKGRTAISASWIMSNYNDASWSVGNAPFWYGSGSGGTQLTDMQNGYTTVFLRKKFEVTTPDSLMGNLIATFKYDDGFRVWVNGKLAGQNY